MNLCFQKRTIRHASLQLLRCRSLRSPIVKVGNGAAITAIIVLMRIGKSPKNKQMMVEYAHTIMWCLLLHISCMVGLPHLITIKKLSSIIAMNGDPNSDQTTLSCVQSQTHVWSSNLCEPLFFYDELQFSQQFFVESLDAGKIFSTKKKLSILLARWGYLGHRFTAMSHCLPHNHYTSVLLLQHTFISTLGSSQIQEFIKRERRAAWHTPFSKGWVAAMGFTIQMHSHINWQSSQNAIWKESWFT